MPGLERVCGSARARLYRGLPAVRGACSPDGSRSWRGISQSYPEDFSSETRTSPTSGRTAAPAHHAQRQRDAAPRSRSANVLMLQPPSAENLSHISLTSEPKRDSTRALHDSVRLASKLPCARRKEAHGASCDGDNARDGGPPRTGSMSAPCDAHAMLGTAPRRCIEPRARARV